MEARNTETAAVSDVELIKQNLRELIKKADYIVAGIQAIGLADSRSGVLAAQMKQDLINDLNGITDVPLDNKKPSDGAAHGNVHNPTNTTLKPSDGAAHGNNVDQAVGKIVAATTNLHLTTKQLP